MHCFRCTFIFAKFQFRLIFAIETEQHEFTGKSVAALLCAVWGIFMLYIYLLCGMLCMCAGVFICSMSNSLLPLSILFALLKALLLDLVGTCTCAYAHRNYLFLAQWSGILQQFEYESEIHKSRPTQTHSGTVNAGPDAYHVPFLASKVAQVCSRLLHDRRLQQKSSLCMFVLLPLSWHIEMATVSSIAIARSMEQI